MTALTITPIVVVLLITAFALLFWRLASRFEKQPDIAEWFQNFSVENYAPMERLLDQSDFKFLQAEPGYRPEIGARLLKERKKLFLGYLAFLIRDFNQLLRIARLMIVSSAQDRADFATALWRQQIAFYANVCALRLRLAFYPLAWAPLDVSRLVRALENLRNQVQAFGVMPAAQAI